MWFFFVFYETKSGMIENQMVNFEPGEYMRKMGFQSVTQVAQKKNLSTPNRNRICDVLWLVTNSDALPLSYRSLVGSKATKLHVL